MPSSPFPTQTMREVAKARWDAIDKHGPLKPGADRWIRLLGEEYREVCDELVILGQAERDGIHSPEVVEATRQRAISELAQLSQLCIGAVELLQEGK